MKGNSKPKLVFLCGKGAGDYLALEKARGVGLVNFTVSGMILVNKGSRAISLFEETYRDSPFIITGWNDRRLECWRKLEDLLDTLSFDYLILCGFPFLLPAELVKKFQGKIINSHHAQLPLNPGLFNKESLLSSSLKFLGATLHVVDEGMDTGPILMQAVFPNPGLGELEKALNTFRFVQDCLIVQWLRNVINGERDGQTDLYSFKQGVMFVPPIDEQVFQSFNPDPTV